MHYPKSEGRLDKTGQRDSCTGIGNLQLQQIEEMGQSDAS